MVKSDDLELTHTQIAKQMGLLDSAIRRCRNDIHMNCVYDRIKTKKNAQRPSLTSSNVNAGKCDKNQTTGKTVEDLDTERGLIAERTQREDTERGLIYIYIW